MLASYLSGCYSSGVQYKYQPDGPLKTKGTSKFVVCRCRRDQMCVKRQKGLTLNNDKAWR
jgi:hypothetical protein